MAAPLPRGAGVTAFVSVSLRCLRHSARCPPRLGGWIRAVGVWAATSQPRCSMHRSSTTATAGFATVLAVLAVQQPERRRRAACGPKAVRVSCGLTAGDGRHDACVSRTPPGSGLLAVQIPSRWARMVWNRDCGALRMSPPHSLGPRARVGPRLSCWHCCRRPKLYMLCREPRAVAGHEVWPLGGVHPARRLLQPGRTLLRQRRREVRRPAHQDRAALPHLRHRRRDCVPQGNQTQRGRPDLMCQAVRFTPPLSPAFLRCRDL